MASPFLLIILVAILPMAIVGLLASGILSQTIEWAPTPLWTDHFGTPGLNIRNGITAMTADKNGFYLAGYIGLPPNKDENPSPSYVFVARHDSSGHQIWKQNIGTANVERSNFINGLAPGSDGIYVTGVLNGTGFVRKYDTSGTTLWTNYLESGEKNSAVSAGSNRVFVVALERFTNESSAMLLRSYSISGDLLWKINMGHGWDLEQPRLSSSDSGIYVSGCNRTQVRPPVFVYHDTFFVSNFQDNGTLRWSSQFSKGEQCLWHAILADTRGVYFFGSVTGRYDGFLDRYDLNGNLVWSQQVDPSANSLEAFVMSKSSSGLFLSGGDGQGTLAKYDDTGHKAWSIVLKTGPAWPAPMVLSALEDSVYVAGATYAGQNKLASIEQFTSSSSLVVFGLHSPYSFVLVGLLAGSGSLISVILVRQAKRVRTKRIRGSPPKIFD